MVPLPVAKMYLISVQLANQLNSYSTTHCDIRTNNVPNDFLTVATLTRTSLLLVPKLRCSGHHIFPPMYYKIRTGCGPKAAQTTMLFAGIHFTFSPKVI